MQSWTAMLSHYVFFAEVQQLVTSWESADNSSEGEQIGLPVATQQQKNIDIAPTSSSRLSCDEVYYFGFGMEDILVLAAGQGGGQSEDPHRSEVPVLRGALFAASQSLTRFLQIVQPSRNEAASILRLARGGEARVAPTILGGRPCSMRCAASTLDAAFAARALPRANAAGAD
eukprot:2516327-Pleurochrysis_carterae.AAC.1